MSNNEIIELIFKNHNTEIKKYIFNVLFHKEYTNDLLQLVYLRLLTVNNQTLNECYFGNKIFYYIKSIIWNEINSKKKSYYKKYIRLTSNDLIIPDLQYDEYDEEYDLVLSNLYNKFDEEDFFIQLYKYKVLNNITNKKICSDLNIKAKTLYNKFKEIEKKMKEI